MKTALLRAARRHSSGTRYWTVPGAPNDAKLVPASRSLWPAPAFHWPYFNAAHGAWEIRGVRLDWHRAMAKAAARELLSGAPV